jgi:hypothetical protein
MEVGFMQTEPMDYSGEFSQTISSLASVTNANGQGMYEVPALSYATSHHPDNEEHLLTHGIASTAAESPIPAENQLLTDTLRLFQTMLFFFQHLVGWPTVNTVFGSGIFTPFDSTAFFKIASVSGKIITCYCTVDGVAVQDPRRMTLFAGIGRDSILDPFTVIQEAGLFVQFGLLVKFANSVVSNNVRSFLVKPDFTGMPDHNSLAVTDTFTIEIIHDVSAWLMTPLDPELPIQVELHGELFAPNGGVQIDDIFKTPYVEIIETYHREDYGSTKVIELKDVDGASCRCAPPYRDQQIVMYGGYVYGSFKIEYSHDESTWTDITPEWEKTDDGQSFYPRFVIAGKIGAGVTTKLYLGTVDDDTRDYSTYEHLRVRYYAPVADFSVAGPNGDGARHVHDSQCEFSIKDEMGWTYLKSTITAKGQRAGDNANYLCSKWDALPSANALAYTPQCCQHGSPSKGGCPFYRHKRFGRATEQYYSALMNQQNIVLEQTRPGDSGVMAFIWNKIFGPSVLWLLNPPSAYQGLYDAAYVARITAYSGGFVFNDPNKLSYFTDVFEGDTFIGQDEHTALVAGGIWNYFCGVPMNWEDNRWGNDGTIDDAYGILPRRLGTETIALTQLSETRDGTNDPERQLQSERGLGRKVAPCHRISFELGTAFSARDVPGIEGENRIQRCRRVSVYVSGLDSTVPGYQQTDYGDYFVLLGAAVGGVKAYIQLLAHGKQTHGHKRISQSGINGAVWRIENLGSHKYKVHCSPGLWYSTAIDGSGDEITTKAFPWYGGANVVDPTPIHFRPDGAVVNSPNACLVGGASHKAVRGDTLEFINYAPMLGYRFNILEAKAFNGDSVAALTGVPNAETAQNKQLTPFFNVAPLFGGGSFGVNPNVEIILYEGQYVNGTADGFWTEIDNAIFPVRNSERPYTYDGDPLLDQMVLYWDLVTVFDPIKFRVCYIRNGGMGNSFRDEFIFDDPHELVVGDRFYVAGVGAYGGIHTVDSVYDTVTLLTTRTDYPDDGSHLTGTFVKVAPSNFIQFGSCNFYLSLPCFGWVLSNAGILLFNYNKLRITLRINGAVQEPMVLTVVTPKIDLDFTPLVGTIYCQKVNRLTGQLENMNNHGESLNEFDMFQGLGHLDFKINTGSKKLYFHPLAAGDMVFVRYKTSDSINMTGFGEPGAFVQPWQPVSDWSFAKKLDTLIIQDNSKGVIGAQSLDDLANQQFLIGTNGVIRQ